MLKKRIGTAVILIPLVLSILFFLPLSYLGILAGLTMGLAAWEWSCFIGFKEQRWRLSYGLLVVGIVAAFSWLFPLETIWNGTQLHPAYLAVIIMGKLWWLLSIFLVVNFPRSQRLWKGKPWVIGAVGLITLIPAWASIVVIRSLYIEDNPVYGAFALLLVLLLVWAADIGAYFVGKKFGKKPLMLAVSPKKTQEGFLGGLMSAIIVLIAFSLLMEFQDIHYLSLLFVGILTVSYSVVGDLTESMFKRCAGVKDSGTLLPGHGGLLDRIDSLLAALPVFVILCYFWHLFNLGI